jgi:hypothetical protein
MLLFHELLSFKHQIKLYVYKVILLPKKPVDITVYLIIL